MPALIRPARRARAPLGAKLPPKPAKRPAKQGSGTAFTASAPPKLSPTPPPSPIALYDQSVSAGFASPSEDCNSRRVDLYTLFSPKPESTFLVKVSGWSMKDGGIHDGDFLLVDRSIEPRHGHVVVAYLEGQGLVAKRLRVTPTGAFLDSDNAEFSPIALEEGSSAKIWGVARAKAGHLI